MIDERYRELIHAEIDGELSDRQRAELASYLLAHPEARAFRDDLRQVCEYLDRIEQVEPPRGLRDSILRALNLPASRGGSGGRSGFGSFFSRAPVAMRYAAAILVALVVGAVAFQFGHESRDGLEVSELVGTMASSGGVESARLADTVRLDLREVSGAVRLYDAGGVLVLEFDLAAQQPIDVVAAYDGHEARFTGFVEPGNLENHRYALSLAGKVEAGGTVRLSFYSAGTLIHEDALQLAGAH
jgi:hypothetical protein